MDILIHEPLRQLHLPLAAQAAEAYSVACAVPCRIIDALGETIGRFPADAASLAVCDLAASVMPGADQAVAASYSASRTANATGAAPVAGPASAPSPENAGPSCQVCENAHLLGCYQAERLGGRHIFFCPLGLTHWISPILYQGRVVGALLGGPVNMVDPEDLLLEETARKNGIHPDFIVDLGRQMQKVIRRSTSQVHSLSEMLYRVAGSLSDESFTVLEADYRAGAFKSQLWEQIHFLKTYSYANDSVLAYPIEKEQQLLARIENGDKAGSQQILNEILGHVFFSSSGNLQIMQARVVELVVLLSRAAIRGGADPEQIFGLNDTYLNKISSFRSIDEIAYWLSGILARFTDHVFCLSHIKHTDVIYRTVHFVRKNYMKKITLEETAALVFLSPAYFSRIFKEEMNLNFNVYVNQVRVEAARKLLINEDIGLADVATRSGFDTQSYFSKVFKRMAGVTPGQYRESRGKLAQQKPAGSSM